MQNNLSDNQTLISVKEVLRRVQRSKAWLQTASNNTFRPGKNRTRAISFVESEVDHGFKSKIYASRGERHENHQ